LLPTEGPLSIIRQDPALESPQNPQPRHQFKTKIAFFSFFFIIFQLDKNNKQGEREAVQRAYLSEWDEARRVGGTDTWATVPDWLVGERELAGVVANHLGLDLNLVEHLSVVDGQDAADHLWQDDHVAQMGLDNGWLLQRLALLLRLAQLLEQGERLALQTARVSPARSAVEHLGELVALEEEEKGQLEEASKGSLLKGGSYVVLSRRASRSTPLYEYLRKALFFLSSTASSKFPTTSCQKAKAAINSGLVKGLPSAAHTVRPGRDLNLPFCLLFSSRN
jgi:hypothetical protein